jgi:hypothetical protein
MPETLLPICLHGLVEFFLAARDEDIRTLFDKKLCRTSIAAPAICLFFNTLIKACSSTIGPHASSEGRYANCRSGPRLQKVEPVFHSKALAFEIGRVGRSEGALAFVYTLWVRRRSFRTLVRMTVNRKLSARPSD